MTRPKKSPFMAAQFNEKFVLQLKKNPMGNDDEATKSLLIIHNGAKFSILLDLNFCDVLRRFHVICIYFIFLKSIEN